MSNDDKNKNKLIYNIRAPEHCSMIEHPENAIMFFREAEAAYLNAVSKGRYLKKTANIVYDLAQSKIFTETSVAILIAHIKDRNINLGLPSRLNFPIDEECERKIKKMGILKNVGSSTIESDDIPFQKVSNLQVANSVAKDIVVRSSLFIYSKEERIKELYTILIELMANTNNHADSDKTAIYPWWLFMFRDERKKIIKFVFLDLGVGIFDSLPVKQYMIREPLSLQRIKSGSVHRRGESLNKIFSALVNGRIKSSTGIATRGKGLPLIADNAKSGHFCSFKIISNDAYIDVLNNTVSAMNQNFRGTLYYFELHEHKNNE